MYHYVSLCITVYIYIYICICTTISLGCPCRTSHSLTNLLMVGMISSAPATGREPSDSTKSFLGEPAPEAKGEATNRGFSNKNAYFMGIYGGLHKWGYPEMDGL